MSGTVNFFDGATLLGTGTIDAGAASFTTTLAVGTHTVTAVYSGDASFNGSTSPVDTTTVVLASSTTALTAAPDPTVFGQTGRSHGHRDRNRPGAGIPSGTVDFFDGPPCSEPARWMMPASPPSIPRWTLVRTR